MYQSLHGTERLLCTYIVKVPVGHVNTTLDKLTNKQNMYNQILIMIYRIKPRVDDIKTIEISVDNVCCKTT